MHAQTLENIVPKIVKLVIRNKQLLSLYSSSVAAGFPSPADDHIEGKLDLNDYLVKHPSATFFVRVTGNSMINAGIHNNDILIVDRSIEARHGKIIIAIIDGQMTVKRLHQRSGKTILIPENKDFKPIEIVDFTDVMIWGVVTNVIHSV